MSLLDGGIPSTAIGKEGQIVLQKSNDERVSKGQCHTIADRITIPASATVFIGFDPTYYLTNPVKKLVFFPTVLSAIGSRVDVDFSFGAVYADDGTILTSFNRLFSQEQSNVVVRLSPTITTAGFPVIKSMIPASSSFFGSDNASVEQNLPMILDHSLKYLLKLENKEAQEVHVSLSSNWFEI